MSLMSNPTQDTEPGVGPGGSTGDTAASSPGRAETDPKAPLPWAVVMWCLSAATANLAIYGWISGDLKLLFVLMLIATGALMVGGLLGFMFGIPRTQRTGDGNGQADKSDSPKPSTNLEQVVDWLTKILVGAGLVELTHLGEALKKFGQAVQPATADPTFAIVAEASAVVFSILGFGAAYLWTRTEYGQIQASFDMRVITMFDRIRERVEDNSRETKEAKAAAVRAEEIGELNTSILQGNVKAGSAVVAAASVQSADQVISQYPEPLRNAVRSFLNWDAGDWEADPGETLFETATNADNGRRLFARIVKSYSSALKIELRVERIEGSAPLTEPVAFLLHPTFRDGRIDVIRPRGDFATSTILSEGWFTVVAISDNGACVLKLSLKDLAGAPEWFTK